MRRLPWLVIAACGPARSPVAPPPVPPIAAHPAPPLLVAPPITKDLEPFVAETAPVIVLQHVHLIDGSGQPGRDDQTIVIEHGRIQSIGGPAPAGAKVLDLTGRSVFPGLVDMHAHLFYGSFSRPGGVDNTFGEQAFSFPRLYLASGVTTARSTGSLAPYADLSVKRRIDAGEMPGPHFDMTAPYLSAKGEVFMQMGQLRDAEETRRFVEFWLDAGFTSLKAYMFLPRAMLAAAIETAHKRGVKITGHLCAVTFTEAADLGIDDLEHGLFVDTDLVEGKQPDECPKGLKIDTTDLNGPAVRAIIAKLVARKVAVTSTLAIFEPFVRADATPLEPRTLAVINSETRKRVEMAHDKLAKKASPDMLIKEMAFERSFVKAGGVLLAGSDPSGYGAVVAGFGSQREVELLFEAGFSPVEALQIASGNGAKFLGADHEIGTIAVGKRADLVVVKGDPEVNINDIEKVEIVFKDGVGYDPQKLIESVTGTVGMD